MASTTLYTTKDAYFKTSSNYGNSTGLAVGNPGQTVLDDCSTALDFNINSTFPAGTTINSAYLRLYRSGGVGAITVRVRGINSLWSETGITGNNMPSLGSSTYTGSVDTGDTYLQVNVTSRVQWHVDNPTRYGFYLDTTSAKGNYFYFYSRESSGSKPRLIVDYTLPNTNDPPNWGSTTSMAAPLTSRVSSATSSISVSWASGTDPDGNTKTYKLECSVNGGTYTEIYSDTTPSYTHSIGSGNPGYTYSYKVRIYDGTEYSGYIYSGTVTKNTPPVFSGTISTSPSGNFSSETTSISVTRPDATDVNGGTLYYTIWVSVNDGGYTELSTNASNPYSYTGATHAQGTTYRFRMQARDDQSETSGYLYSATITKNTLPTAPTSVLVSPSGIISTGTSSLIVSWSGASSDTSSYRVYKYKNGSLVETVYPTTTSITDSIGTGNAGATYYYRVYSKDAIEFSSSYKQSATVTKNTLPSPPTTVTISPSGSIPESTSSISVGWSGANANDSGQSLKYDVYRYKDGSSTKIASLTSSTTLTDTIGAGNQGSSYYYRVDSHDGLEPSSSYKQSATATKNTLTGATLASSSSVAYASTGITWTWSGADNSNQTDTFTYRISSSDITIYNQAQNISSGYVMPIYKTGTAPSTPYIKFNDIKTKFAGASYKGSLTFVLTTYNNYGSSRTSSKAISVDIKTSPTGLTAPTLAASSYYTINSVNYYIPNRKTITINWGAATDPLGTAITYDVAISLDGGSSYTNFRTGLSALTTTYSTAVNARKTTKFRVIAKSAYGYTQTQVSASTIYLDYWDAPTVSITGVNRTATGFTFTGTVNQGSTSASALNTDYPTTTRYYKLGAAANVYSTTTYTASEIALASGSSSTFVIGYRNWGYYGIVSTTGYTTDTVSIPTYQPMFSIREKGVAVNSLPANDGYKFRVAGNVLISPDVNGDADLVVNGDISEGGTLLSNRYVRKDAVAIYKDTGEISVLFNSQMDINNISAAPNGIFPNEYGQIVMFTGDSSSRDFAFFKSTAAGVDLWVAPVSATRNAFGTWEKLWHSGNDGSGSGLEADKLDGEHATRFALNDPIAVGSGYTISSGIESVYSSLPTGRFTSGYFNLNGQGFWYAGTRVSSTYGSFIAQRYQGALFFVENAAGVWSHKKIWYEDNDGSGSGLDADTLDTLHAAEVIDSVDTAGQNLVLNSHFGSSHTGWETNQSATLSHVVSDGVPCLRCTFNQSTSTPGFKSTINFRASDFVVGQKYTISFKAKSSADYIRFSLGNGQNYGIGNSATWKVFKYTTTLSYLPDTILVYASPPTQNQYFDVAWVKIEVGEKTSAVWTPALEQFYPIERGTESTGHYIKLPNGMMQIWRVQTINVSGWTWTATGSLYRATVTLDNFPFTFTGKPTVHKTVDMYAGVHMWGGGCTIEPSTTNPGNYIVWSYATTPPASLKIAYTATGWWK